MDGDQSAEPEHPDGDDAEIEVGALRPPARRPGMRDSALARWSRQSMTLPRPVVAAGVLVLVVLAALTILPGGGGQLAAVLAGPTPTPTSTATPSPVPTAVPATPTPSPFPTPTLVAPPLGAIPTNCAPSPTGPGVGGFGGVIYAAGAGPVWVDGFHGSTAIISITRDATGPYTEYGWPVFTALALKRPFDEAVTLRGTDLSTGDPLWFSLAVSPASPLTPLVIADPQQFVESGDSTARWWSGGMYLPGAGCYTLQASWQGGGWQITFAAGQ